MQITFFGVIWLIILLLVLLTNKIQNLFVCVLFSMVLQCNNVFYLNGLGVGPQVLTCIVFSFRCFFEKKGEKNTIIWIQFIFMILLCVWAIFSSFKNNSLNIATVIRLIQLFFYMLTFYLISIISFNISFSKLDKIIKLLTIFLLIMGLIQVSMTSGLIGKSVLIKELFFNDNSLSIAFNNSNYYRISSTLMEPSFFAPIAVSFLLYFLIKKKKRISDLIIIIALVVEIIFTRSSTAYIASFIMILWTSYKKMKPTKFILLCVSLALISIILNRFGVLDSVLFDKLSSNSGKTRTRLNNETLALFENSPIYGNGYKSCNASSLFVTLLGELGVVGLALYVFYCIPPIFRAIFGKNRSVFNILFCVCILCQLFAGSQLDLSSVWFILFLYSCGLKKEVIDFSRKTELNSIRKNKNIFLINKSNCYKN